MSDEKSIVPSVITAEFADLTAKLERCGDLAKHDCCSNLGGDPSSPSWKDYLDGWADHVRPHFEAIRKLVLSMPEEEQLLFCANRFANDYHFAIYENDKIIKTWSFSWRGWGDLVQACRDKREGYMKFYYEDW